MLRELNAVSVRVEHVDEPHLAGELEDDADLTPSSRSLSASVFTSATSTIATPPSVGSPSASAMRIAPCSSFDHLSSQSTNVSSNPSTRL